jgi:hypothetical protein
MVEDEEVPSSVQPTRTFHHMYMKVLTEAYPSFLGQWRDLCPAYDAFVNVTA